MPDIDLVEKLAADNADDARRWNELVADAPIPDAYYRAEYVQASARMEGTKPGALIVSVGGARYLLPYLARRLTTSTGDAHDMSTPYGYGGVLPLNDKPLAPATELVQQVREFCRANGQVVFALRLNPLLEQVEWFSPLREASDVQFQRDGTTYSIDLTHWNEADACPAAMTKGRRSDLSLARRRLRVELRQDEESFAIFRGIYDSTMERKAAAAFLRPDAAYYQALRNLGTHIFVALAFDSHEAVGGALFLIDRYFMHYHLSGTTDAGRELKATTRLIVEAAAHGRARSCRKLHLGGGMHEGDSLSSFKKSFGGNNLQYASVLLIADQARFRQICDADGTPWPYLAASPGSR